MKQISKVIFILILIMVNTVYAMHFNKNELTHHLKTPPKTLIQEKTKIFLNKATVKTLKQLKGIGSKRAKNIVAFRNAHGPFQQVNDLTKIKGFNKKFIQRLIKKNKSYKILV